MSRNKPAPAMRVIAGQWRGRPLVAPAGHVTRPTNARAREALFSMLASRLGSFEGLEVADLFAGSGALGLEALSRGAARCRFVERDPAALAALKANIAAFGAGDRADVISTPVEALPATGRPADLILLDPPYGSGAGVTALARLHMQGWVAPGAWISLETEASEATTAAGFVIDVERSHGKAHLTLMRAAAADLGNGGEIR